MKLKYHFLAGALLAAGLSLSLRAQEPGATPKVMGAEKPFNQFIHVEVKNLQDETLGRILDLGIDLVNGRIVEVLVETDNALVSGSKVVAVPPLVLSPDAGQQVYRLDASTEVFKNAPAIDVSEWTAAGRSDRVAAAYRHFRQEPYFREEGAPATRKDGRPLVALGYVERTTKLLDLPVVNHQDVKLGKVWSLTLDIPRGRILNVIVQSEPTTFMTRSIVPAMALSFNPARDGLLLDDTLEEFADEPRFIYTAAAFGQDAYSHEEAYKGPRTSVALEQGASYRDEDRTDKINRDIRVARINGRNVKVGTLNGRVTLRGWVHTENDKRRIGEIAIEASRLELVDNQIVVGRPIASN